MEIISRTNLLLSDLSGPLTIDTLFRSWVSQSEQKRTVSIPFLCRKLILWLIVFFFGLSIDWNFYRYIYEILVEIMK